MCCPLSAEIIKDSEKRAMSAENALEAERSLRQKTEARTLVHLREAEESKSGLRTALEQAQEEVARRGESYGREVEQERQRRMQAEEKLQQQQHGKCDRDEHVLCHLKPLLVKILLVLVP